MKSDFSTHTKYTQLNIKHTTHERKKEREREKEKRTSKVSESKNIIVITIWRMKKDVRRNK